MIFSRIRYTFSPNCPNIVKHTKTLLKCKFRIHVYPRIPCKRFRGGGSRGDNIFASNERNENKIFPAGLSLPDLGRTGTGGPGSRLYGDGSGHTIKQKYTGIFPTVRHLPPLPLLFQFPLEISMNKRMANV